jgi:alpha-tubulin suppressor-like RCC1 family protein
VLATASVLAAAPLSAAGAATPGPFPFPLPIPAGGGTAIAGWGTNEFGELGTGQASPAVLKPVLAALPPGTRITQVAPGCDHTLALTSAGTVLAWGQNFSGELGNGTVGGFSATPQPVRFPDGTGRIRSVSAGCSFSIAVTTDGKLLTWGINGHGQLGNGKPGPGSPVPLVVAFPGGFTVRSAAAGFEHALAVGTNGQVEAWGDNSSGELGNGSTGTVAQPAALRVAVQLPPGTRVSSAAAGVFTSFAVTTRGGMLSWGSDTDGDLGIRTVSGTFPLPQHVLLPPLVQARGVFTGCNHTVALTTTGSVLAWGDNGSGQIGVGSSQFSFPVPVRVPLPNGGRAVAIGGGCVNSSAVTTRGQMLSWGSGDRDGTGSDDPGVDRVPALTRIPPGFAAIGTGGGANGDFGLAVLARVPAV